MAPFLMRVLMKIIYRIETEAGLGMYASGACFMRELHIHVTPRHDWKLWEALQVYADSNEDEDVEDALQEFRFGFSDLVQLRKWVYRDDWIGRMNEMGLVLVEYECEDWDVLEGYYQAVFKNPKQAKMNFLNYIC